MDNWIDSPGEFYIFLFASALLGASARMLTGRTWAGWRVCVGTALMSALGALMIVLWQYGAQVSTTHRYQSWAICVGIGLLGGEGVRFILVRAKAFLRLPDDDSGNHPPRDAAN